MSKEMFQFLMNIRSLRTAFLLPSVALTMILLLSSKPAYSQKLLIGVKVAGQITNTFTYPALPEIVHEDRVLFGPTGQWQLSRRLSIEVDALYKAKLNTRDHFFFPMDLIGETQGTRDVTAHSWEFPVLVKWHPPLRHDSFFVAAGVSTRHVAGTDHEYGTVSIPFFPNTTFDTRTSDGEIVNHWTYGPVIGAGVDIRARRFHLQPELRYTRWNDSPFFYVTKQDDFQALIGVTFGKRTSTR